MKLLLPLLAIIAGASAESIKLNTDNIEHITQIGTGATTGDWIIKFIAPWCGHCQALGPEWEKFAKVAEGKVNVGEVDITVDRPLSKRFNVASIPKIVYFHKGQMVDFNGPRTEEGLRKFTLPESEEEEAASWKNLFAESDAPKDVPAPISNVEFFFTDISMPHARTAFNEAMEIKENKMEVAVVAAVAGAAALTLVFSLFCNWTAFAYLFATILAAAGAIAYAFHTIPEDPRLLAAVAEAEDLLAFKKNAIAVIVSLGACASLPINFALCRASGSVKSKKD
jgi:thiol-disulfide isomerase/thioredoxin